LDEVQEMPIQMQVVHQAIDVIDLAEALASGFKQESTTMNVNTTYYEQLRALVQEASLRLGQKNEKKEVKQQEHIEQIMEGAFTEL
jgi:hypothetical protein